MMPRAYSVYAVLAASVLLSGCLQEPQDDLASWMTQQRATVRPQVETIAEPKAYTPREYRGIGSVSPFSDEKLTVLLRGGTASPLTSSLITAELDRRKEPLEFVPLDSIVMVGVLDRGREKVALVKSGNLLYQVRRGDYMGQNYGRVTEMTETQITLREIVQDAAGEWVERPSTLQLQEVAGQ